MKNKIETLLERLIQFCRGLSDTGKRTAVFILAVIIAFSTIHTLTFPATAMTRRAGEEAPGIELNEGSQDDDFDGASEEPGTENNNGTDTDPAGEQPQGNNEEPGAPADSEDNTDQDAAPAGDTDPEEPIVGEETEEHAELSAAGETDEEPLEETEESDPEADVETAADWEAMFKDIELSGVWADDLLMIAESQIGYGESSANFIIDDEGVKRGYTRYGAFYGTPYAKWDSLFIVFDLFYAGIPVDAFPYSADCAKWAEALNEQEMFFETETYVPVKGDLVFADTDEDGEADHVGLIKEVKKNEAGEPVDIVILEGDMNNAVEENTYEYHNPLILGYGKLPENPDFKEAEETTGVFTGSAGSVEVTVEYGAGTFPDGASMEVKEVSEDKVLGAIQETAAEENKEIVSVQAVDISFYDAEGKEIQPEQPIKVTMKSVDVPREAEDKPVVVHVDDDLNASVVRPKESGNDPDDNQTVSFEAKSFSVYAIVFTVDFAYELDGKVYTFRLKGGESITLSELSEALGIIGETNLESGAAFAAEAANVSFTDETLIQISRLENDWKLTSLSAFDTEETLTITMKNGNIITVKVTDADKVYGLQIHKYIVDQYGNPINFTEDEEHPLTYTFKVYSNPDGDADSVKDLNIGEATTEPDYSGYSYQHDITLTVDGTGEGMIYDYNVSAPALYYISEIPGSIRDTIIDTSGETWNYTGTYFNTEYAWRNHRNDNYRHVSKTYTGSEEDSYNSVPEILGDHNSYDGTEIFTNDFLEIFVYNVYETETVDVPVKKTWAAFASDSNHDWEATFKLQWAPIYGNEVPGADTTFRDVSPIQEMTITKTMMENEAATLDQRTFHDLPKYGTDRNGNPFRYQYSLQELSYEVVNTTTGLIDYAWSLTDGYNSDDEDTHFAAFYPHDAGETSADDADYHIDVSNALRNIRQREYIDVALNKQWDSTFAKDDTYYAEFELRRFAHVEYRDTSEMSEADRLAAPVTVTVQDTSGAVIDTLSVQPNEGLYVAGNFKPHDSEKSISFSASPEVRLSNNTTTGTIGVTAAGSNMSNALVRSGEFFVTQDTVIRLTDGSDNLVTEGKKLRILDTSSGTNPLPDRSFSRTIRLDNSNGWHVDLDDLIRSETSAGDNEHDENVTYYEYYFVETGSSHGGYPQYYRMGADGTPTDSLYGDSDHQIEEDANIVAVNGPSNRLEVKKYWRGVPDTTGFPHVTFTLYQTWADGHQGWVYENPETHARYEHIEIPANTLSWVCPEVLPATKLDNGISRAVKYYVQEDVQEGSTTKDGITTGWKFYYYLTSQGRQYNAGNQGYFAAINGDYLAENGGSITICNRLNNYINLDIQKQFFKLREAGSWDNVTSQMGMGTGAVLGFKVIRAIKAPDGRWLDASGNESDTPVWSDYSDEMLCGYDANNNPLVVKDENDMFFLEYAGGDWHFRIRNNDGDRDDVKAGGSGLPVYGYYIRNGENIPVEYWYSFRETNVYKNTDREPFPEWDWFSSITPVNAYGPGGTMSAFPKAFHGQDDARIANFQASDLIINKEWLGDTASTAKEVYVKVWRKDPTGALEDFTAVIADDVKNNNNWQMYLTDPSMINVNRKWLILKDDGTGTWTDVLKVNRALLGTLSETGTYQYYIQEVGYMNKNGTIGTNPVGKYHPVYDKWVDNNWQNAPQEDYESVSIKIGAKGENRLKVINTAKPSTSYTITKSFAGTLSHSGGKSSVDGRYPTDGSKQVVVELQQRYRYERINEQGVAQVSADNENWVNADSDEAESVWTVDWQGAESANPTSVVLPLPVPEDYTLSEETWYSSKAAWTYTWEGLDLQKVVSADADPTKSKIAQLYYRAVEVSTPGWINDFIEPENGHKAVNDDEQTPAQVRDEKNDVINKPGFIDLNLKKEWTGLDEGEEWPKGYVVRYQIVQNYHLAATDTSHTDPQDDTKVIPEYRAGQKFASVNMTTNGTGDKVHPQAVGTLEENNHNLTLTGFPKYGFVTATSRIVSEAAGNGVTLEEGKVYPVVYTYNAVETAVLKNGEPVAFSEQNVSFEESIDPETDKPIGKATLTNELGIKAEKIWSGLTPGENESATIKLYRFVKETAFSYTVSVVGNERALNSNGSVSVTVYNSDDEAVQTKMLNKETGWSHTFRLPIDETYHAVIASDGEILEPEITVAGQTENITSTASAQVTASVIPVASGKVKLVIAGTPHGLWIGDLMQYVNGNAQESTRQKFGVTWFDGRGGETEAPNGLYPGEEYRFNLAYAPNSCDGGELLANNFVSFIAEDGIKIITLNYGAVRTMRMMKAGRGFTVKLASPALRSPASVTWHNDASTLPAGANPEMDTVIDTVTFSGTTWSKTWEGLPKDAGEDKEYVYYVYETDYSGAAGATEMNTSYSISENGTLVVTNTPTYPESGNLKVEKEVFYEGTRDLEADELSFTVGVFTDAEGTVRMEGQEDKIITLNDGFGEVTFTDLPAGTYYVYEIVDGAPVLTSGTRATIEKYTYEVTYTGNTAEVTSGTTVTSRIINTKQPFNLNLLKIEKKEDGQTAAKPLDGAEFKLNKLKEDSATITYDPDFTEVTVATRDGGKASFSNLASGYYEIRESKAPKDYVLTGESTFYIKVTSTGVVMVMPEDGKRPEEWKTGTVSGLVTFTAVSAENPTALATVENEPGYELPKTGGIGTGLFNLLGGILILFAGIRLLKYHRNI